MPVPKETICHIAELARLKLTPPETEKLSKEMTRIVDYCKILNELKVVSGTEIGTEDRIKSNLRDDIVKLSLPAAKALENAPETRDQFFVVPRVIE